MKTRHIAITTLRLLCCAGLVGGCQKPAAPESDSAGLKVEGEKVIFPENSPQIESLAVTAAEKPRTTAASMTGRLVWNDDITVRVFSPVSGRVSGIVANAGQKVMAGDVLARVASPEFGQAQA